MHAVVVTVNVESGREREGVEFLHSKVLPGMKQVPGLVAGYWLDTKEGQGLTVLLLEDADAARATAEGLRHVPVADFASLASVETREVVASV